MAQARTKLRKPESLPAQRRAYADKTCGCTSSLPCHARLPPAAPWIVGSVNTPIGDVPVVSTRLEMADRLGAWKARWAIDRREYRVVPGLYAVGNPTHGFAGTRIGKLQAEF